MNTIAHALTLESATDNSPFLKAKVRSYLSEELNIKLSETSFDILFSGYYLPIERFRHWPECIIPNDIEHDIRLWLFLRFLGRKPKLNTIGEFDAQEAKPFSEAFIHATKNEQWANLLYDPLENGYLPY
jgi:hypothetical protein|tara:strand:- start:10997 stop:11383 length:387 start_codon:yes stop_codon:yes gene_type:complete